MDKRKPNNLQEILKTRPVRLKKTTTTVKSRTRFLELVGKIEDSREAKDMRERLLALAKKIETTPEGSDMSTILDDLARSRRILAKNPSLRALYSLQAKSLLEEAEFKRTGKRIIID